MVAADRLRITPFVGSDRAWDEAVAALPGSTFCHLAGWRHVLAGMGHETHRLVAEGSDGRISGILPLSRVRSRLFGDYLISMPFLSYGGPLGPPDVRRMLAEAAVGLARSLGVDLLELRGREQLHSDLSTNTRKLTVLKRLPADADTLWQDGLRSKLRSQIRRPTKAGMTTQFGNDLVSEFYGVFACTMRDLGTPVLPKSFFDAIVRYFPERAMVGVVNHEGRPVAAGVGFTWGGEVEITWAGARRELAAMAPNMLLYWAFMEESIRRGATVFNFGRCSPGSGTHQFKSQWGGEDHPLPWSQWSAGGVASTPRPDAAKFKLATAVWRRLPLAVTNNVGPVLARRLP